jgi:hypothetical protein
MVCKCRLLNSLGSSPANTICAHHREHPEADEVFVTGTFDDWGKTEKLNKLPSGFFEKKVQLPSKEKILYKVR